MKKYWFLLLITSWLNCPGQTNEHSVTVRSSQFFIDGKTNVGQFNCDLYQLVSEGTLTVKSQWTDFNLMFEGLRFKYQVDNFRCDIPTMTKDLQNLLKSDQYPHLFLEIHSIKIDRSNTEIENLKVAADVTITLSGNKMRYSVKNGRVINRSEEEMTFSGRQVLKMTDFGIEPPTKFFGLVQVTDELTVEFEIDMLVESLN